MVDLHSEDAVINHYADRYRNLMPLNLRKVSRQKSSDNVWDETLPLVTTEVVSRDNALGALVGLAVGDAVGTTLEFKSRDSEHVSDMQGGGPFILNAGEWTDDTSMALCVAETYLAENRMNTDTLRKFLLRWYQTGENSSNGRCFDIGNTTRFALEQYLHVGPSWYGNTEKHTAGNAGLVRQAPVSIFRRKSLRAIYFESQAQSRATHGAVESIDACQFLGLILHHLINGHQKEEAFSPHVFPLCARVMIINAGEYKHKARHQIRSSGYVIDTLEAAMWAVWNTDNFRDAILLATNLADDADSVAATAGQLAGALYGYSEIPQDWKDKLVQHERIAALAGDLFDRAPEDNFL
ncbi:ADP-ribosylarginine hydrolase Tri1 [Enterobacter cloacae]|uniref:ADP-ribosylarginine hydrolase Tri1 n=1 Tax=Enterobacter TaxID=547 RepID=UPI000267F79B|nr:MULTISPECIES: ADP-ribosylarginine hydrolase Tri1 [Enterobacter]AFM60399.1 ADP-ribosyl-[dinitrogen reductase] glycohydrolase [Enterobacter cloacae subsp. dissolvens SDM]ELE9704160.1 ADP-ribosylglycohydrolase family protein [Enterobacter cloacae]MBE1252672.1 ADP-ribosylglycohydrolase family protein [Enterobacter cloacae]MBF4109295.1 ADP-ribosylglycohydrolase family protein [Enterobacter cloacae]MCU6221343.1 ADP-ribosylglycohydrolase family protein [Enterobacter cloacae]